jgi:hypothetical protein
MDLVELRARSMDLVDLGFSELGVLGRKKLKKLDLRCEKITDFTTLV